LKKNKKIAKKKTTTSVRNTKRKVPPQSQTLKEDASKSAGSSPLSQSIIYVVGESPLVEQYAELCAAHGYDVYISWNEPPAQKLDFKFANIRVTHTVPLKTSVAIELTNIDSHIKRKNLEIIAKALPETAPILSSSITVTATEQSGWIFGKHRLVGIAALPTCVDKPLVETAPTIFSPKETVETVSRFFRTIGKEIEIVQDRVGMVLPRIVCQVINETAFAITEEIATPQDIDKAMTLGMQYPLGPIKWAEQIGFNQVYAVLKALHAGLQEERYRIAPLLQQMALAGTWWKQDSTDITKKRTL
jgi:3-hydroxybutyryl-CoA dehydrogenase